MELEEWKEVQQKVLTDCNFVLSYGGIPTSKHTLPRALEKLAELASVHRIKIHALRHSHASLLISMGENQLIIKERLGHEKIQTTLGTYGHLYPNSNFDVAKKLTGLLTYTPATHSVADYTSNQFTAEYHNADPVQHLAVFPYCRFQVHIFPSPSYSTSVPENLSGYSSVGCCYTYDTQSEDER